MPKAAQQMANPTSTLPITTIGTGACLLAAS
jgi:hypothetical protein